VAAPHPTDPRAGAADDRTDLARYRTQLALDRTLLAWVRTTLSMVSFGFGIVAFFRSLREAHPGAEALRLHLGAIRFGLALAVLGLVTMVLASGSHWLTLRALRRGGRPVVRQWPLSLVVALLLAALCVLALGSLFEQ
jgi:putative membrane protein